MLKRLIYSILPLSIIAILFFACEKEEFVGPNLLDIYGPFEIIDSFAVQSATVDFTKQENITFKGSWTLMTPWTITITGQKSGAVKTLSGKSKFLDTLVDIWDGTSDVIFFKEEKCDVELTFGEHANILKDEINIIGTYDYTKNAILLQDYEIASIGDGLPWGGNGTNPRATLISDSLPGSTPQGNKYLYMEGKEPGGTSAAWYLVGFPSYNASSFVGANYYPFKNADTTTTFINFFVKSYGTPNTKFALSYVEDQNNDGVFDENVDPTYGYDYIIDASIKDWVKVSIPLSDFETSSTVSDGEQEIDKIGFFYVNMFSNGESQEKHAAAIDYIIITQGKPL